MVERTTQETVFACPSCDMEITVRGHEVDGVDCPECDLEMEWESDRWVKNLDGEWVHWNYA